MIRLLYSTLALLCVSPLIAQNWPHVQKVVAGHRGIEDEYGYDVAIDGKYAVVGAHLNDRNAQGTNLKTDAGAAYVYEMDSMGQWKLAQTLLASDRAAGDEFGWSVAIDGEYIAVVAQAEDEDASGKNTIASAGAVYIFKQNPNGIWQEHQKLVASDRANGGWFRAVVAINGADLIVGARHEKRDSSGAAVLHSAGAAYLFKRFKNDVWNEVQKIVPTDRAEDDYFGHAVDIEENTVVIGAPQHVKSAYGEDSLWQAGAAYIFEKDTNGLWKERQKIVSADRGAKDYFGGSVSISEGHILVGAEAEKEDTPNAAVSPGAAYLFGQDKNGRWSQLQKLTATNREAYNWYGIDVYISGSHAVVGAIGKSYDATGQNFLGGAGLAYMYKKQLNGNWVEDQKIQAPDRGGGDWFGFAVATDGQNAIVSALRESEDEIGAKTIDNAGSAYIFNGCHSSSRIFVTACKNYKAPSGNFTWETSGNYTDIIPNAAGCDSLIHINLTVGLDVTTTVNEKGTAISANNDTASAYQWINCNLQRKILGADRFNFQPLVNGSYAVAITQGGCIDTSDCRLIMGTEDLLIYPNPSADGRFHILYSGKINRLEVWDIAGRRMSLPFNLQDRAAEGMLFKSGVYILKIYSEKSVFLRRIVVAR